MDGDCEVRGVFRIADDDDDDDEQASPSSSSYTPRPATARPTPLAIDPPRQAPAFLAVEPSPTSSTSTLHHHHHRDRCELASPVSTGPARAESSLSYARRQAETFIGRLAVVIGFACTLSGITIYAGACRTRTSPSVE
jgi:hypothetical protein